MKPTTNDDSMVHAGHSVLAPSELPVKRRAERLGPQHRRVLTRFFDHGSDERVRGVIERIMKLGEDDVVRELDAIFTDFAHRHRHFIDSILRHYGQVSRFVPHGMAPTRERQLLIGAYFTHEYSISAAAMFNPSIVRHPDQSEVPPGAVRFIMSFRATGEGHISSVEFREGLVDADGEFHFEPITPYIEIPELMIDSSFDKRLFGLSLKEIGVDNEVSAEILRNLGDEFTLAELEEAARSHPDTHILPQPTRHETVDAALWLAKSNYVVRFPVEHGISERVLFPVSENESRGIEDARFVRFVEDDGSSTYYATYTAYNGFRILPQLIETTDFMTFKVLTLNGPAIHDKGMALFPRRVNGRYVMLGRQDGQNIYIMYSDHLHFWYDAQLLQSPMMPWEFVQIGNNGSPIETEAGWIVLTHGVGAMRRYCIGCTLLDLNDPTKILGRLRRPLLTANTEEREGYVPNVVYTCGAMIHNGELVIPYAISDLFSGIATISVAALLDELLR